MRRRPTSADVATEAGVSRTTVSFVLNGRSDVKIPAETRVRVLEAAERLGYHPHGPARQLAGGRSHTIALVLAHEPAGQRDLSTPGVRDRINETLRNRKEQLLRSAYLTTVRNEAEVVNYLARRLVEAKGEMPSLPLAAPGKK